MKRPIIVTIAIVLLFLVLFMGCKSKSKKAKGLTPEEQRAVDYVKSYVWVDPSTGKESAKNIEESMKTNTGPQSWSEGKKVFTLGDWKVEKYDKNTYFVKILVTPNTKIWEKVGKKTTPPKEAIWKVDFKNKKVFAHNPEAGFLSWVEK